MTLDAALAVGHHMSIFGILAVLVAEAVLLRPGLGPRDILRIARIDRAYGMLAGAALAIGASRVFWGAKPEAFYLDSAVFWAKMSAFLAIGLLSIWPTVSFIRWRRAGGVPREAEVRIAGRLVRLQLGLFIALPVLAVLMARGVGH